VPLATLYDAISDALFFALSHCSQLRFVTFTNGVSQNVLHTVTAEGIIALAKGCTALEELRLPYHVEVSMEAVGALSRYCPNLRTLQCAFAPELRARIEEVAGLLPNCKFARYKH
jgi:hypothetical protein